LQGKEFVENRFRDYTPDELIAVSLAKPARFAPGTNWRYSNTNYIILGQLIEQVTGTPYAVQLGKRILGPLGLRNTWLPGNRTGIRSSPARWCLLRTHGGIHGYRSFMFSSPDRGTRLEFSVTTGTADLEDPEAVERISAALNDVLIAAVCDSPPANRAILDPAA
jgi:D-alanyl-D-alanine carboxypeptidase